MGLHQRRIQKMSRGLSPGCVATRVEEPAMNEKATSGKAGLRAMIALSVVIVLGGAVLAFDGDNAYSWAKAFHIIAVIAWMAGLLYLPRLFVYHHRTTAGGEASDLFKQMEFRLFRIIMNPAMMIAWILGLYLA